MREILFRGQHIKYGQKVNMLGEKLPGVWVYGGIFPGTGDYSIIYGGKSENFTAAEIDKWPVYSETVGQYTGLTDKNGKKIFEGDIVDLECDPGLNELWVFDYGNCGGVQNVAHDVGYMGFYLRPLSDNAIKARDYGQRDDPIYYLNALRLRIVGNIHDNPELLEGGADDER